MLFWKLTLFNVLTRKFWIEIWFRLWISKVNWNIDKKLRTLYFVFILVINSSMSLFDLLLCKCKLCSVREVGTRSPIMGVHCSWLRKNKRKKNIILSKNSENLMSWVDQKFFFNYVFKCCPGTLNGSNGPCFFFLLFCSL